MALIAYDQPYPEPLHAARPIASGFGVALVLVAAETRRSVAALDLELRASGRRRDPVADAGLEALRHGSTRRRAALPCSPRWRAASPERCRLDYVAGTHLACEVDAMPIDKAAHRGA